MGVMSLSAENFAGRGEQLAEPTWVDVEGALRRMDGSQWWMLSLERPEASMVLEGGDGGHFGVGWSRADGDEHYGAVRLDADPRADVEMVVIGGQTSEIEARMALDLELALRCVRVFFDTGTRATDVSWETP
jgi:hypothetical protein